jgi:hypothetical protein
MKAKKLVLGVCVLVAVTGSALRVFGGEDAQRLPPASDARRKFEEDKLARRKGALAEIAVYEKNREIAEKVYAMADKYLADLRNKEINLLRNARMELEIKEEKHKKTELDLYEAYVKLCIACTNLIGETAEDTVDRSKLKEIALLEEAEEKATATYNEMKQLNIEAKTSYDLQVTKLREIEEYAIKLRNQRQDIRRKLSAIDDNMCQNAWVVDFEDLEDIRRPDKSILDRYDEYRQEDLQEDDESLKLMLVRDYQRRSDELNVLRDKALFLEYSAKAKIRRLEDEIRAVGSNEDIELELDSARHRLKEIVKQKFRIMEVHEEVDAWTQEARFRWLVLIGGRATPEINERRGLIIHSGDGGKRYLVEYEPLMRYGLNELFYLEKPSHELKMHGSNG